MYDIVVSGTCVGQYNNKGSFGELALMYNTPRAATIIATQEGALWGLVRTHKQTFVDFNGMCYACVFFIIFYNHHKLKLKCSLAIFVLLFTSHWLLVSKD